MSSQNITPGSHRSPSPGELLVVGIGPGSPLDRTPRASAAILSAHFVIGYHKYMELIADLTVGKETISTGMMQEMDRVRKAIALSQQGYKVALVSSGDPGVYGMAGLALEMLAGQPIMPRVEIIPGITAANSAAARLGAPLMLDYCCISLSDLMVPWESITKRLTAAGQGDFVVALYNPRSHKRRRHLEEAVAILHQYRPGTCPVGIVHSIGLAEESIVLATLDTLLQQEVHMRSLVLIGNSTCKLQDQWIINPRGYLNESP